MLPTWMVDVYGVFIYIHPKKLPFLKGFTFSKAHHLGALQPLVFGGVGLNLPVPWMLWVHCLEYNLDTNTCLVHLRFCPFMRKKSVLK